MTREHPKHQPHKPAARLYVPGEYTEGAELPLSPAQAHYLRGVLRLAVGARIAVFGGEQGEWLAEIAHLDKKGGDVALLSQTRPQAAEGDIWLAFAPIKAGRIDWLVEKAAELGVSELHPVLTRRTVMGRVNTERLQAHAVEAAEQCERLTIPPVHEPRRLEEWLAALPPGRQVLYGDETGGGKPIAEALEGKIAIKPAALVGPEGGFAPEELEMLRRHGQAVAVSLGPRVLRADTAAIALLSCIQAWAGDWRQGRPRFAAAE